MRLLPILLLLLAACSPADRPQTERPWLPNYSTPEKATETYMRAIETGDINLAVTATAPAQREANYRSIGALLTAAREQGVTLKVEPIDGTAQAGDGVVVVDVRLSAIGEDGKASAFIPPGQSEAHSVGTTIFAFEQQQDGSWRFSPGKVAEIKFARSQSSAPQQRNDDAAPIEPR